MNSSSNKITQIKDTIKEIRYDINEMEKQNDQKMKSFLTSISPHQQQSQSYYQSSQSENNSSINDIPVTDIIKKYDSSDIVQSQIVQNRNSSLESSQVTPMASNQQYYNNNSLENDKNNDEAKLRRYLQELQDKNYMLMRSLHEKKIENETLIQRKQNEDILSTIKYLLEGKSVHDIMRKIDDIQSEDADKIIRNELIGKMKSLYIVLTGATDEENVDIKTIWRWIKHLIRTVKEMSNEKENTGQLVKELNDTEIYKEFCIKLIKNNKLGSIAELKGFINDLLAKNNISNKRIHKLKKVLFLSPQLNQRELSKPRKF